MFNIGDKIYTIRNKKLCEYEITQISNFKTKAGEETDYLVSGTSGIFRKIDIDIDNIGEFFTTKAEAEKVLEIVKRYC